MDETRKKTCGDNGGRKRDGTPCEKWPMRTAKNGRCRKHRGTTATGPQVGSWKHGRRSKYWKSVSGVLRAARERVEEEGRAVLSLYEGVATMDVRLAELSAQIEGGDSPDWRVQLAESWERARTGDPAALVEHDALIRGGAAKAAAWKEMLGILMQRGQRAENAMALDIKRDEQLTRTEVLAAFESLIAAVTESLPVDPCPHCHTSGDRATARIRELAIIPDSRRQTT